MFCYLLLWQDVFFVSLAKFMFNILLFFTVFICATNGSTGLTIFQTVVQQGLCFMFYNFLLSWLYLLVYIKQILCFMFYFFFTARLIIFLVILYSPYNSSTKFMFYVLFLLWHYFLCRFNKVYVLCFTSFLQHSCYPCWLAMDQPGFLFILEPFPLVTLYLLTLVEQSLCFMFYLSLFETVQQSIVL